MMEGVDESVRHKQRLHRSAMVCHSEGREVTLPSKRHNDTRDAYFVLLHRLTLGDSLTRSLRSAGGC